jgi:hypothetical protein
MDVQKYVPRTSLLSMVDMRAPASFLSNHQHISLEIKQTIFLIFITFRTLSLIYFKSNKKVKGFYIEYSYLKYDRTLVSGRRALQRQLHAKGTYSRRRLAAKMLNFRGTLRVFDAVFSLDCWSIQ